MTALIIYGASDDLVEIKGLVSDEFYPPYGKPGAVVVKVDDAIHSVANIEYADDGVWRFRLVSTSAPYTTLAARGEDEGNDEHGCPGYSEKLAIDMGEIEARQVNISVAEVI